MAVTRDITERKKAEDEIKSDSIDAIVKGHKSASEASVAFFIWDQRLLQLTQVQKWKEVSCNGQRSCKMV